MENIVVDIHTICLDPVTGDPDIIAGQTPQAWLAIFKSSKTLSLYICILENKILMGCEVFVF
jgi:hypothetical protein